MSYILDSLKKAEQQRQQGQVPGLQADHAPAAPPSRRTAPLFWLLLLALLVNAGMIAWWVVGDKTPVKPTASAVAAIEERPVPVSGVAQPVLTPRTVAAGSRPSSTVPPVLPDPSNGSAAKTSAAGDDTAKEPVGVASTLSTEPTKEPLRPTKGEGIPRLSELPSGRRQGLPQFTLSLHYYTAEPTSRMVRINNRNLRQGDSLDGGIELQEITPEGVVLSAQGELFRLVNE